MQEFIIGFLEALDFYRNKKKKTNKDLRINKDPKIG